MKLAQVVPKPGTGLRRVLPKPVDFGHLIPLIDEVARTP